MSVQEEAAPVRRPNKAPWQNMPGAPQRPNLAQYSQKISALVQERRDLISQIKDLQSQVQRDPASEARNAERSAFREKLSEIDALRKTERNRRALQDAEIAKLRKRRGEISEELRSVQAELGGFTSAKEIDEAIKYLMLKMESRGGGLGAERRNQQQLRKLEDAKTHLLQLQPLTDAIKEITDQEVVLQQEYLAISEKIAILNKEYEEEFQKKQIKDKEVHVDTTNRAEVYKQCDTVRERVKEISESISSLHAEREKAVKEWDEWNNEAREKYFRQQEEQRERRHKEYEERRNAHKIAAKRIRAEKRQNPYVVEISACGTLIQYLKQKKMMLQREEEERIKREAAAHFDPAKVAPAGCVVLNEGKWSNNHKPLSKAAKKQQQKQQPKKEAAAPRKADATLHEPKERTLQHSEEKVRLFQTIEMEPTSSLAALDEAIREIEDKCKAYESFIKTGELTLSSDDDEEAVEEDGIDGTQAEPIAS